jgi:hypothetical protein
VPNTRAGVVRGVVCCVIRWVRAGINNTAHPSGAVGGSKTDETRYSYRSAGHAGGGVGHWGGGGLHAGVASADDLQISIDGMDLFPTAGNTATATSGMGDIAIAIGNGADAAATGGPFDSAFATGDGSTATAGYGNFDTALANGTGSGADAAGDILNHTTLIPGDDDFAYALGPHTIASSGDVFNITPSSYDVAMVFDPFGTVGSSAYAGIGNFDLAAVFGDSLSTGTAATGGNFLVDILPMLF